MAIEIKRRKILINGIVQGVGFRPTVYRYAREYGIKGFVANTSNGVIIEAEAAPDLTDKFLNRLLYEPPALAEIHSCEQHLIEPSGAAEFEIIQSMDSDDAFTLISPDIAICDQCRNELFDKSDRRYRYPFINCTNCGPRYTIIKRIPYDRPYTTMSQFTMCRECYDEYKDPENRRFHAQPNCCPECGPEVWLTDPEGRSIEAEYPIESAAELLHQGRIIAVKGLGGFHLACNAADDVPVSLLRERKGRYEKPLAVMVENIDMAREIAVISEEEEKLLLSGRRPIVIVKKRRGHGLAEHIAPSNNFFGILLPYTPIHYLLIQGFKALVMTSGNYSDEPIAKDNKEALGRLGKVADYFLLHNRDIHVACDDSVTRVMSGKPKPIRRSRGYVPTPVILQMEPLESILATGAELKNTICVTRKKFAFLSQHIGDLKNLETLDYFKSTIEHLKNILDVDPEIIACDLHPEYLSTKWAKSFKNKKIIPVQHHHAHIASCLAENQYNEKVIGLAMDGTGYGTDGAVWGGEILIADTESFVRAAHFSYRPIPGGDSAVKNVWRMAAGYISHFFGIDTDSFDKDSFLKLWKSIPAFQSIDLQDVQVVSEMIRTGMNTPKTSSLGRLFDGVAAISGIRNSVSYEGQAAIEFEAAINENEKCNNEEYAFEIEFSDPIIIGPDSVIRGCVNDAVKGVPISQISCRFHAAVVNALVQICISLRKKYDISTAALSGGCFQNKFLLEKLTERLTNEGFEVLNHSLVPVNDGGISLGQAAVAASKLSK
ncbi:carbamoyltransferase HypF [bacterium]|nr:carbamoyltransferase HypF [bacterium]